LAELMAMPGQLPRKREFTNAVDSLFLGIGKHANVCSAGDEDTVITGDDHTGLASRFRERRT
jgi:hypothetical protein